MFKKQYKYGDFNDIFSFENRNVWYYALTEPQKCSIPAVIEGSGVFVSTQTGSGKSLTYECFPLVSPGKTVIVQSWTIRPEKWMYLGLEQLIWKWMQVRMNLLKTASLISCLKAQNRFWMKKKWRDMLTSSAYQSKLGLIAVDEAHTVIQW